MFVSYSLVCLCNVTVYNCIIHSYLKAAAESPGCAEHYLLLGQLYWDMGEEIRKDRSKVHSHLLKVGVCAKNVVFGLTKFKKDAK